MLCSLRSTIFTHTFLVATEGRHLNNNGLTENWQQDGRLAPAYCSPNYIYFDQLLQTV